MSQTGTIYGCHDGNTYTLANVYDERLNEYNSIETGEAGDDVFAISFNRNQGYSYSLDAEKNIAQIVDSGVNYVVNLNIITNTTYPISFYKNATELNSRTLLARINNNSYPIKNIIQYVKTTNAAEGFALQMAAGSKHLLEIKPFRWIQPVQNSDETYSTFELPSYEYSGRIFLEANGLNPIFSSLHRFSTNTSISSFSRVYNSFFYYSTTGRLGIKTNYSALSTEFDSNLVYVRELDSSTFDSPFHFRLQRFNSADSKYVYKCFINGELYFYTLRTGTSSYSFYDWEDVWLGAFTYTSIKATKFNYHSNLAITDFKVSLLSPVYQKITVPANMLIRHADANHYVPLTADAANTTAPYIAVRHGNTNFYTLK